jgi:alpha-tubulin suppressor-like RCC1 family protein
VGVTDLGLSFTFSCAIGNDKLRCWGNDSRKPDSIGDLTALPIEGAKSVAAGLASVCVILDAGGVKCWGVNSNGQLGPNAPQNQKVSGPVPIEFPNPIADIDCGGSHCCAIGENGRLWCWGGNSQGQLGNGVTEDSHPEPDPTVWKTVCGL